MDVLHSLREIEQLLNDPSWIGSCKYRVTDLLRPELRVSDCLGPLFVVSNSRSFNSIRRGSVEV
ncbi:hypothetical protein ACGYKB_06840 [Sulfitobacter sp. 916]|uniref:hypothetical protein n=1 Tax=unclassified Sulfitobacter TaxID=196795 RepID=UPI0012376A29|nr:hypothetical protein [Sulfitobacter sp. HI0076]MCF7726259.1 hypothetical protein [Sulfitobacter sp. M22]